ncbi:MAG: 4Fe-4S binding protein [Treponema sp.]|nr:4Fe-4S binding protein [Treponema sp.]
MKKQIIFPLVLWLFFMTIALSLGLTIHLFYLFNFTYIGTCVAIGLFFHMKKYKYARLIVLFAVGLYMFLYLGVISNENMQIEGFWILLFNGVFYAAVLHYLIAKIFGPLLFGRAWCGYACWTAMILELLPYKIPQNPRKNIGYIRYIVFAVSLIFGIILFLKQVPYMGNVMFWCFIAGNILYYVTGITLALLLKDNRAFCKYICPITVFLKPASYFALLRVKINIDKCISCNKCKKVCPMDVDMMVNSRKRVNGTECILCLNCIEECPQKALHS